MSWKVTSYSVHENRNGSLGQIERTRIVVRVLVGITCIFLIGGAVVVSLVGAEEAFELAAGPYNWFRPMMEFGSKESCISRLDGVLAEYEYLEDQQPRENGPIKNAVTYYGTQTAKIYREGLATRGSVTLSCKTATNLSKWLNEIDVREVRHFGAYNYRTVAGSAVLSEHSFATAIDIMALDDARVLEHWNDDGEKGDKLKEAASKACRYFSNVLTPDYNDDHLDHFHLDNGPGFAKVRYWLGLCD